MSRRLDRCGIAVGDFFAPINTNTFAELLVSA
jgi:hypothetical protein